MMRILYLGHSGFAIEYRDGVVLVFDFYTDTQNVLLQVLERAKHIYVFVSHSHPDHYNHRIFSWQKAFKSAKITFIISGELHRKLKRSKSASMDVPCTIYGDKCLENDSHSNGNGIVALRRGKEWSDGNIAVNAFGSTDIGVSFMVTTHGKSIFHAGDLNNWHWSEESTPQEIKAAEGNYLAILRKIKARFPAIYLAMFPVDPRIGGDFSLGARQFVHSIDVEHFIPMHQWGDFGQSCSFGLYRADRGDYHCMLQGETIVL